MATVTKRLMYVNRRAPYGTIYGLEALDVLLTGAAFDQEVSAVFLDDGVYQLKRGQDPSGLGMKHYTRAFGALPDFDVSHIYVEHESLTKRGMAVEDLIKIPQEDGSDSITIVSSKELSDLMFQQDVIIQL